VQGARHHPADDLPVCMAGREDSGVWEEGAEEKRLNALPLSLALDFVPLLLRPYECYRSRRGKGSEKTGKLRLVGLSNPWSV